MLAPRIGEAEVYDLELLFLRSTDQGNRAIELVEQQLRRDPLNASLINTRAAMYINDGEPAAARSMLDRAKGAIPGFDGFFPAFLMAQTSHDQPALEQLLDRFIAVEAQFGPNGVTRSIQPLLRQPDQARAVLRARLPEAASIVELNYVAGWADYFGDSDLLLAAWNRMLPIVPGRGRNLAPGLWSARHAEVRRRPEFKDLLNRMGLPDYWRKTQWGQHCRPVGETDFECD
jgi:hypothetical protein